MVIAMKYYPLEDSVLENKQFQDGKDAEVEGGVLIKEKDLVKDNLHANEEEGKTAAEDVDYIVQLQEKTFHETPRMQKVAITS